LRDTDPAPPSIVPTVSLLRTPALELTGAVDSNIAPGGSWYPQIVGLEIDGGDASAGRVARLFSGGRSDYLLYFDR
jgi:hypothetical protein